MSEQYQKYNYSSKNESPLESEYRLLFDRFAKDINSIVEDAIRKIKNCQTKDEPSDLSLCRRELHKLSNSFYDDVDRMIKTIVSGITNKYKQGKLF